VNSNLSDEQSDSETGFSPITSVYPCHLHSPNGPFIHHRQNTVLENESVEAVSHRGGPGLIRREVCGVQSGTGKGFSPISSVFPCRRYSSNAPYLFIGLSPTQHKRSI
jgi:hypothetical protein